MRASGSISKAPRLKGRSLKIKTKSRTPFFFRRRIVIPLAILVGLFFTLLHFRSESLSIFSPSSLSSKKKTMTLDSSSEQGSLKQHIGNQDNNFNESPNAERPHGTSLPESYLSGTDTDYDELDKALGLNDEFEAIEAKQKLINSYSRVNATFFSLVRNDDLEGILEAINSVEERFNHNYHYDWVFANDEDFTAEFIQLTSAAISGNSVYAKIPEQYWGYPSWIDQDLAADVRDQMESDGIKYGDSESYRHMCRFNSGFFYRIPEMLKYKYYWRVEPDIQFNCDINYDLFKYMKDNNKVYGFAMAPFEIHTTVLSLWSVVKNFTSVYPEYVTKGNNFELMTDDEGETFNMCHFWSNFEIGDMDFYRTQRYSDFFEYMDLSGGFFYERWGDAPVHTMAVALFLKREQVHYVDNTGYYHSPNGQCPRDADIRNELNCDCDPNLDFNWAKDSCIPLYYEINGMSRPGAVSGIKGLKSHKDGSVNSNPIVREGFSVIN